MKTKANLFLWFHENQSASFWQKDSLTKTLNPVYAFEADMLLINDDDEVPSVCIALCVAGVITGSSERFVVNRGAAITLLRLSNYMPHNSEITMAFTRGVEQLLYQLCQLRNVQQRSLTLDARRTLTTAFIASRLDYCNALLYWATMQVMRQLQMVMNAAARMMTRCGRYAHITPVLRDVLHRLPVPQRIQFKIVFLAFSCIRGAGPAYSSSTSVFWRRISHGPAGLLSAERGALAVRSTAAELGKRSFSVAASVIWNSFADHLRSSSIFKGQFRRGLKTHIFQQTYNLWEPCVEECIELNWMIYTLHSKKEDTRLVARLLCEVLTDFYFFLVFVSAVNLQ